MTRVVTIAACATIFALGTACQRARPEGTAVRVVTDTVHGVPRVRNAGPAPVWQIDHELTSRSGTDGDGFGRIVSVVADAAGLIYAADRLDARIYVLGADGRPLRTLGRRGAGPGEFRDLYSLAWIGDTLAALDPGNARIALFTGDGRPTGTWRAQALSGDARVVRLYRAGPRQFFNMAVRPAAGGSERVFVRYGPEGPGDTLAGPPFDLRNRESSVVCHRPDGGISFFGIPFAPSSFTTFAPGGRLVYAWRADYRLVFLGRGGDTVHIVDRVRDPIPIADDEWRAATAEYREFRERNGGAQCEPASLPRAAAKPALRHVLFDDRERMWVEATTAAGWAWEVFDPSGRLVGTMPAPSRNEQIEPFVRNGRLYVVAADSLGEPLVQVYRFTPEP